MRRLSHHLLLFAALLFPLLGAAAPVRPDRAQALAATFLAQSAATRAVPRLQLLWQGEDAVTRASGDPAIYLFNRTDAPGFVIVAGDDAVTPVLGYSFENGFGDVDRMPANLRTWLSLLESEVLRLRAAGVVATSSWQQPKKAGASVRRLTTAAWGQGAPYNNECPEYKGKHTATGCTQTAAAIVMKYNRWPDAGVGSFLGYTTETNKIRVEGRTLGAYDWTAMDDVTTKAGAAAVAKLMADLGVMTQADYGEETGAYTDDLLTGLVTCMKYSKQALLLMRDGYTDAEWIALMKREIDADRPVIYGGVAKKAGGHQFLLDGYTDDGYFYVNWGWDGVANGCYLLGNLAPQRDGAFVLEGIDDGYGFSFRQNDAIVGLVPDPDGTSQYADQLLVVANEDKAGTMHYGLSASTKRFRQGVDFTVELMWALNCGALAYDGEAGISLYDRNGVEKERINRAALPMKLPAPDNGNYSLSGYFDIPCRISAAIADGDYLAGSYLERSSQTWQEMRAFDRESVARIAVEEEDVTPAGIAAATRLTFDRSTRILGLQAPAGLQCRITGADGSVRYEKTTTVSTLTIDTSKWTKGRYTLTLTAEGGEPYTLRLVL